MGIDRLRSVVTTRPGWFVGAWAVLAAVVGLAAPDLTRIAAEGQAHLVDEDAESYLGAKLVREAWPEQAYESEIVVTLHRPSGLTESDRDYARRLAARFESREGRPSSILRVLGPSSRPAIADRLVSKDRRLELVVAEVDASFVAPSTEEAVSWLRDQAGRPDLTPPSGLAWRGPATR